MTKTYSISRTYVLIFVILSLGEGKRLLKLAVEKQRWDIAAYFIVLTIAKLLGKGDELYD